MGVLEDIKRDYPTLAFLANDREVGPLLRDAVDPNKGFSPTEFQSRLYNTSWFKKRSASQREWEILANTDKGEANRRRNAYYPELKQYAASLGLSLSDAEVRWISEGWLARGISPDSAEAKRALLMFGKSKPNRLGAGAWNQARAETARVFKGEFFMPLDNASINKFAERMVSGTLTAEQMRTEAARRASHRYYWLKDELQAGRSMEEIFDPHRQVIADELGVSAAQIDFMNDPNWRRVVDTYGTTLVYGAGASKQHRAMTLAETTTLARMQPAFWRGKKGRELDAGMANQLLSMMGKRA